MPGQWDEAQHPRADDGKFGEGGGGSDRASKLRDTLDRVKKARGEKTGKAPQEPKPKAEEDAPKKLGDVGDYDGVSDEHRKRIEDAREHAVNMAAMDARSDFLKKHGLSEFAFNIPADVARGAQEAADAARASDLSSLKDRAERSVRDTINAELVADHDISAATAAGHLRPVATERLDKLTKYADATASDIKQLGDDLHDAQQEAAVEIARLSAYRVEDHVDDDGEDTLLASPIDESTLQALGAAANGSRSAMADLLRVGGRDVEVPDHSYDDVDPGEHAVPDVPEFNDDIGEDPAESSEFAKSPPPRTLKEYVGSDDVDMELAKQEHDDILREYETYKAAKAEYDEKAAAADAFKAAVKKRTEAQRKQAAVAQSALEKVHAKQIEVLDRLKSSGKEYDKLHKLAVKEVDDVELLNDVEFRGRPGFKSGELDDPGLNAQWERARRAADELAGRESSSRSEMSVDFADHAQQIKDAASETAAAIKALAKITKRPAAISKSPKASKAKPATRPTKARAAEENDDDDEDEE